MDFPKPQEIITAVLHQSFGRLPLVSMCLAFLIIGLNLSLTPLNPPLATGEVRSSSLARGS